MENNNTHSYHYLYVPGNKLEFIDKAINKGVKNLIIDLEDSIPWDEKDSVRESVCDFIEKNEISSNIHIRTNSDYALQKKDLESLSNIGIENVFIPKLELDSAIIKNSYSDLFSKITGIIETATGLNDLDRINENIEMHRVAIGEVDFSADLGIDEDNQALLFYRSQIVFKSNYLNLEKPISGVYKNIRDYEGLKNFAIYVKALGFGGMQAIHPDQIEVIDKVFKPTEEEIENAKKLLLEIEKNEKMGIGVFVDNTGSIVDGAMIRKAKEIISQSE